jgi:hypothetical protein
MTIKFLAFLNVSKKGLMYNRYLEFRQHLKTPPKSNYIPKTIDTACSPPPQAREEV